MKLFERKKECKFHVICDINEVPDVRRAFNPIMDECNISAVYSDIERIGVYRVRVSFEMNEKPSRVRKAYYKFFEKFCRNNYPVDGVIVA